MNQKKVILTGVITALTAVVTRVIQIPTPLTGGYINLGDIIIIFAGFYLGSRTGAIVGGIGSAIADILSGYPFYFMTLIIKGLEGAMAGLPIFSFREDKSDAENEARLLSAGVCAALLMVAGYFVMQIFIFGIPKALSSLIPNGIQGAAGVFGALLLFRKKVGRHISRK